MQHGSPPAALVVWAAERIPTPVAMRVARVTVDLMRPLPVAPLTIESEVLREGRKMELCAVRLLAEGRGRGRRDRAEDQGADQRTAAGGGDRAGPAAGAGQSRVERVDFSFEPFRHRHVARRRLRPFRRAGPGAIW